MKQFNRNQETWRGWELKVMATEKLNHLLVTENEVCSRYVSKKLEQEAKPCPDVSRGSHHHLLALLHCLIDTKFTKEEIGSSFIFLPQCWLSNPPFFVFFWSCTYCDLIFNEQSINHDNWLLEIQMFWHLLFLCKQQLDVLHVPFTVQCQSTFKWFFYNAFNWT